MSEFRDQALKKLQEGAKNGKFDRHASVMKTAVRNQLELFCDQDDEFAQAVVQGGSFEDCMKAVAKSCGQSLSDHEAYQRAVQFYFPGAKVKMQCTIDLIGDAAGEAEAPKAPKTTKRITLDLAEFL